MRPGRAGIQEAQFHQHGGAQDPRALPLYQRKGRFQRAARGQHVVDDDDARSGRKRIGSAISIRTTRAGTSGRPGSPAGESPP